MITLSPEAVWSSAAGITEGKEILAANRSSPPHVPSESPTLRLGSTFAFPSYL
jgi:hypothetical protein